jgi:hypothetical protein
MGLNLHIHVQEGVRHVMKSAPVGAIKRSLCGDTSRRAARGRGTFRSPPSTIDCSTSMGIRPGDKFSLVHVAPMTWKYVPQTEDQRPIIRRPRAKRRHRRSDSIKGRKKGNSLVDHHRDQAPPRSRSKSVLVATRQKGPRAFNASANICETWPLISTVGKRNDAGSEVMNGM